jgi:TrmH family RNA methyltransferase
MLDKIRIVLIETSHPGNIGSVARAMKTMGLTRLYLVKPKQFPTSREVALATSAADILNDAIVCETFEEAVADCEYVFGSGSILRGFDSPVTTPREAALDAWQVSKANEVAFVFGRESSGMSNAEMQLCQKQIQIPTTENCHSLNLAAAVQIIAYEIRMASLQEFKEVEDEPPRLANHQEMEGFFEHLKEAMQATGFYKPEKPFQLNAKMRRLFNASQMRRSELDLLRGFLKSIQTNASK